MEALEVATNIAVIIAAVTGIVTLILNIVKNINTSKPAPFRRKLEYINKFGDYIANHGNGPMTIIDIKYFYDGVCVDVDSLVELYTDNLSKRYDLMWSTFLKNSELKKRVVAPREELMLVEIDPTIKENMNNIGLSKELLAIREKIKIQITYKSIYGCKKEITL